MKDQKHTFAKSAQANNRTQARERTYTQTKKK